MKIQYEILLVSLKAYQRFCLKLTTILLVIIYSSSPNYLLAQKIADTNPDKKEVVKKPVKHTFENIMLINNQTVETPKKNSLHFGIQHRFGRIDQGFKDGNNFDLFGLLGVANVRIGLVYGITNRLSIGLVQQRKIRL